VRWTAALLAMVVVGASPAAAQEPTWQQAEAAGAERARRVADALGQAKFAGLYAVATDGQRVAGGTVATDIPYQAVFPLASFTEQVVATMVMQEADAGRVALDAPAARYLPALGRSPTTVRQLLQYRSGPYDPKDGAKGAADPSRCLDGAPPSDGRRRYDACDYAVLGALLERVSGRPLPQLYAERVAGQTGMAALFQSGPDDIRADANWAGGPTATERQTLVRYGAAGGLVGTAADVLAFDAALLDGRLLSRRALAQLWRGDPARGGQALGQWSFLASLKGCAGPVRIVERRGGIGRFQLRNLILPDRGLAMVMLTTDGRYDFGEIRQRAGAAHDALSAAACS